MTRAVLEADGLPPGFQRRLQADVQEAVRDAETTLVPGAVHVATFGVQYSRDVHPTLGFADPDSCIRIEGVDYNTAHAIAHVLTDGHFAFLYPEASFDASFHPVPAIVVVIITER